MDFRGSVKILPKIFSVKAAGLPKFRHQGGIFWHQATTKIKGEGLRPRSSYDWEIIEKDANDQCYDLRFRANNLIVLDKIKLQMKVTVYWLCPAY